MFNIADYWKKARELLKRKDLLIIAVLVILFFATRLINLDQFPIFSDEGIYIRWAKIAWKDANWRFISLTDGRQPLQTWGTIPFLKLFSENALFAGRLFSVFTGFFGLVGIFVLTFYLFGKLTAYASALLYIFVPYFLFYDRMALADSGVNAFAVWIFFFSILLARLKRLDIALFLGFLAGGGLLVKSSMRLYLGLAAFAPIFILFEDRALGLKNYIILLKDKFTRKAGFITGEKAIAFANFYLLYALAVLIAAVLYNVQRLSPFFHYVEQKNKTFVLTIPEFLSDPLAYFPLNLKRLPYFMFSEMGFVVGIVGILGLVIMHKKNKPLTWYFLLWLLIPYFAISAFAKVLYPRYILPLGSLLIIPAAYFLTSLKNTNKIIITVFLIFISVSYFDYALLFDHLRVPFPQVDRGQYLEGWPSGIGAREIVEFAREKSRQKPVILLAEGNFGMSGDVLDVFLKEGDTISIRPYWPLNLENLQENQNELKKNNVYVVFSHRDEFPVDWPIKFIKEFDKPGDESKIFLYELTRSG